MLRLLCAILILAGVGLFGYRAIMLDFPLTPDEKSVLWSLEIQTQIGPSGNGAKVGVFIPPKDGRFRPMNEKLLSDRMSLTVRAGPDGNRKAIWSGGNISQPTTVYYRARYYHQPFQDAGKDYQKGPGDLPDNYRFANERSPEQQTLAGRLMSETTQNAYDDDVLTSLLLDRLRSGRDTVTRQLLGNEDTDTAIASAAAFVLSQNGKAARVVHGILLGTTQGTVPPVAWVERWTGDEWQAYDVKTGDPVDRNSMLALWRGDDPQVTVDGASLNRVRIGVMPIDIGSVAALAERRAETGNTLVMATLLDLPINTQLVVQMLLTIPIGVLVLVFLRQFVGIPTFGTFMPVLIALAFNATSLVTGLIILGTILLIGMSFRFFFSKLNLLLVPRLAATLTVIVMAMILVSVAADSYSLGAGFSVTLFPIVILTMTIERLSVTWEENGPEDAAKEFAGSIVVAVAAYFVMNLPLVRHLVFIYPELLLVVLAIMLMMGRYSGFRLSELRRFRDLSKEW